MFEIMVFFFFLFLISFLFREASVLLTKVNFLYSELLKLHSINRGQMTFSFS
uniref:Uncharacterized protein n=1 Tax=Octopus bimaculoides TaxID=37653 RepID=A0A0L8GLU5_OCTBM